MMEKREEEGSSNPHPSCTLPTSRPGPRPAVTLVVTLPSLSPACRQRKEGEACTAGGALSPRGGDDPTAACRATCPCRSSGEEGEGDPPLGSGRPALALCRLVHGHLQEPGQTAAGCPSRRSSLRQWWDGVSESYPPASQFQRALSPSSAHGCRSRSSSEGEGRRSWQACRLSARPSRRAGRTEPEPPPTGRLLPMAGPRLAPRASSTSSLAFGNMLTRQPPPTGRLSPGAPRKEPPLFSGADVRT
jgi:hypothetical protein